ncbi:MAG: hypothetical protein KC912_08600 [Proteobacteria bacterium]|nr:hypothetical protein [Pseudomonadota bacterium]
MRRRDERRDPFDLIDPLIRALASDGSSGLGPGLGAMARHRDRISFDPSAPNAAPLGLPLDELVDPRAPADDDNRSVLHRSIALLDGTSGLQVCNRDNASLDLVLELGGTTVPIQYPLFGTASECELIRIDNLTQAYAQAAVGTYELEISDGLLASLTSTAGALGIDIDAALELSFGIDGLTRHPTPAALTRLLFWGLADASGTASCVAGQNGGTCNSTAAGQMFDPVLLFQSLTLAQDLPGSQGEHVLHAALARAVTPDGEGMSPIESLAAGFRSIQRMSPGTATPLSREDHERVFNITSAFVDEHWLGLGILEAVLIDRGSL